MSDWQDFELDKTIHDFDYTRRAVYKMNRIMDSSDFETMDADAIFHYLSSEMDIVLFSDFLKRYIYEKAEIDIPFHDVTDSVFQEIIEYAFTDSMAPYAFKEIKARKSAVIKRWLTNGSVRRETIFILGFGLKMSAEDVSTFLTKVIKEEDFDFTDPEECILWFCFQKGLPYSQYSEIWNQYQGMMPEVYSEKTWDSISGSPKDFLISLQNLKTYLMILNAKNISEHNQRIAYSEFILLYDRCREIIAEIRNREEELFDGGEIIDVSDITPADIEKELCSGIPFTKNGNLEVMTRSCFSSLFENKRMSRQRIISVLKKQRKVERFDLITLLFFIYAETVEPDWPAERYLKYIDKINEILHKCGMADIYPVNPYEAFVLMCIVTDYPLNVYAEIWEKSYSES